MWSRVVVITPPALDEVARLAERIEHLLVQALVAQPADEALGEGILLRLAGRDVVPGHARHVAQLQDRRDW